MSIDELKKQIQEICRKHGVKRMDLFGSRARSGGAEGEDFDFVVELEDFPPGIYSKNYFALLHALEDTLREPVDLLTRKSIGRASLIERIDREGICLYEK